MRLFFISLAIAIFCLLPDVAEVRNWTLPGFVGSAAFVPRAGLEYMTVFFHELGHTVTNWSYGRPAVPAFNFRDGGGVAVPLMDRSLVLQGAVYLGAGVFAVWMFRESAWGLLAALAALVAVHAGFATNERYEWPISYMGNGGAVVMGCFCIWRAALNKTVSEHSPHAERFINMLFGLYAVGKEGFVLAWQLITSDVARSAYDEGIGESHMANDFTVLADRLDTRLEHIAEFHLLFTVFCLTVMGFFIFTGLRGQQEEAAQKAVPPGKWRRPPHSGSNIS